jgi:hypothetical protein
MPATCGLTRMGRLYGIGAFPRFCRMPFCTAIPIDSASRRRRRFRQGNMPAIFGLTTHFAGMARSYGIVDMPFDRSHTGHV